MTRLLAPLIIFCAAAPAWAFSLNISPPSVEYSVSPGDSVRGAITVSNNSQTTMTIRAYVEDWVYADDGTKSFRPKGSTPYSCGNWIHLVSEEFELPAGADRAVPYTITTPADFLGGRYAVIFFESTIGQSTSPEGSVVRVAGRIGSIVYLEAAGLARREVVLERFEVLPPAGQHPLRFVTTVTNRGNAHATGEGIVNLLNAQGDFVGKQALPQIRVLPNDTRRIELAWPTSLAPSRYQAVLTVDFHLAEPLVEEAEVSLTAAAQIGVPVYAPAARELSVTLVNHGDIPVEFTGTVSATQAQTGTLVDRWEVAGETVLPQTDATLTFRSKQPWSSGRYRVVMRLEGSGVTLTREETLLVD